MQSSVSDAYCRWLDDYRKLYYALKIRLTEVNCAESKAWMIYVINLPKDVERRRRMERLLTPFGLPFRFIQALQGSSLSAEDLSIFDCKQMNLSPAEFGCMLSHVKAWKTFLDTEDNHAIILEDDVHFSEGFKEVVSKIQIDTKTISLYRLETFLASVTIGTRPRQTIGKYKIVPSYTSHGGAAAYMVNRKTALYLSRVYYAFEHAVDIELFAPDRRSIPHIEVFQCVPSPCIQDQFLGSSASYLKSHLAGSRADEQTGILRQDRRPAIKNFVRPLYLAAYSLLLKFRAKRRAAILFG
jgi:glycosyl transferase, family 25